MCYYCTHQTNSAEINWKEGATKAARDGGGAQGEPHERRHTKVAPLSFGNGRLPQNPRATEEHRTAD